MKKILFLLILILFLSFLCANASSGIKEKRRSCPKVLKQCTNIDPLIFLMGLELIAITIPITQEDLIQQCKSCCVSESPDSRCINRCLKKCNSRYVVF